MIFFYILNKKLEIALWMWVRYGDERDLIVFFNHILP